MINGRINFGKHGVTGGIFRPRGGEGSGPFQRARSKNARACMCVCLYRLRVAFSGRLNYSGRNSDTSGLTVLVVGYKVRACVTVRKERQWRSAGRS